MLVFFKIPIRSFTCKIIRAYSFLGLLLLLILSMLRLCTIDLSRLNIFPYKERVSIIDI